MTMRNQSYAIERFLNNFSEKKTITEVIDLIKHDPKVDLLVDFKSLPLDFSWSARSDQLTGSYKIMLLPKLYLNGEPYEAPAWQDLVIQDGFSKLETAFMKALKKSVSSVQRSISQKKSTPSLKLD